MSGYTSGNNAPTQMAQAPNRKGNMSKHTATGMGGATAVTRPQGSTAYAAGHVKPPVANGKVDGRNQKVMVKTQCDYDGKIRNDGYMNSDRNNFLK
jgi:hypothetical protein